MSKGRLIRVIISVTAIGLAICGSLTRDRQGAGSALASQGSPSGAQEKSAGQEFKNVQVLKDLPASQLRDAMFFIASSLGVRCDYCHVQQFEKDEKPAKQTARLMILMMQKINAENFGGKTRVNCATCHQGRTAPITMPPLASESSGQSESTVDPGVTLDDVLDRYVKALGGKEALEKITSRTGKGTLVAPNGMKLSFQTFAAPPNKTLFILETPARVYREGFNGSVGWVKNQNGVTEMSPSAMEQTKLHADFYRNIKLKQQYASIKLTGKTALGPRAVYEVKGETRSGTSETLYFDCATGLLVRWVIDQKSPFGPVPEAFDFEDYRDAGGVKTPFLIKRRQTQAIVIQQYEEVNQNVPIDPAQFEKPASQ
jgi:hypothetical protein